MKSLNLWQHSARCLPLLALLALPLLSMAGLPDSELQPRNPFLADSDYAIMHSRSDFTPLAGPTGPGRKLRADEIQWKTIGPINGYAPTYSPPYPNGKRVVWVGGYDRVTKLDADTLDVLTTYAIGGNTYFGDEEIQRHIAALDKISDDEKMVAASMKVFKPPFMKSALTFYRMLSKDNELYLPYRYTDGSVSLQVYGEVDPADPASEIKLKREWKIPRDITTTNIMGVNMSYDGRVIINTQDGVLFSLARDFSSYTYIRLPKSNPQDKSEDILDSFVRNGVGIDDKGGIYVVTRDHLHRVQWTGEKLSMDEADGAWAAAYPNEKGIGSGTTPALMGWGAGKDHLVVIADGSRGNKMVAFWRDAIPADWKGLPGYDRRVAGATPIHYGVSKDEEPQTENGLVVYGYGAFLDNSYPERHLPYPGSQVMRMLMESFYMGIPGHEAKGGTMIRWDPQMRTLKTAWQNQTNFTSTVCTISGATEILYCWGARNREWTLEGVDWHTGKNLFHYTLGKSQRFNPMGAPIIVAPNGAIDCGCAGGFGMVRVTPRAKK